MFLGYVNGLGRPELRPWPRWYRVTSMGFSSTDPAIQRSNRGRRRGRTCGHLWSPPWSHVWSFCGHLIKFFINFCPFFETFRGRGGHPPEQLFFFENFFFLKKFFGSLSKKKKVVSLLSPPSLSKSMIIWKKRVKLMKKLIKWPHVRPHVWPHVRLRLLN